MAVNLINNELALICPDPVIGVDRAGIITLFNPAAERLLGYSSQEMVGQFQISQLYESPESAREIKRLMYSEELGEKGQIIGHKAKLISNSGKAIPIQLSACILMDQGEETGSVGFFHDLTERLAWERSLKHLSVTDSLTGLFNQRHFHTILGQEIERSKRFKHSLSLVCFDLDNFKSVNDQLGHIEGDLALRFIGEAICRVLRLTDFGFRYGGDEFMIILPETNGQDATHFADRLISYFNENQPSNLTELAQETAPVALSIGIAEYSDGEPPNVFTKRADLAMYQAKKQAGCSTVLAD
jgi:diguanylate cyclase (GGDEF)-like protein/PAS domain S-box-containing protein